MSRPAAVLFDLDGTLVDSNSQHVAIWERVFRDAGHPFDREVIHRQIGKGGDNLVPALLPQLHKEETEKLSKRHDDLFKAECLRGIQPFPDAHALVQRAAAEGIRVVFASSASNEELQHYVRLLDAEELLDTTTSKDDAERSKPDPGIFAAALKRLKLDGEQAVVVGDTPYDIEAAARCRVPAIALLSGGFDADVLRSAGAVAVYKDAADLLARFDQSPLGTSDAARRT